MIYSTTKKYKDLHSTQPVKSVKIHVSASTARLEVITEKKKALTRPDGYCPQIARLISQNLIMNAFITELILFLIIVFLNEEYVSFRRTGCLTFLSCFSWGTFTVVFFLFFFLV